MRLSDRIRKAFNPLAGPRRTLSFLSVLNPANAPQPDQAELSEVECRNPTIYRVLDVPACDAASVPLQLRRWTNRDKGEFEIVADPLHAVRACFDHINDIETPSSFWRQFFVDYVGEGNSFVFPVMSGGVPVELRRLDPGSVAAKEDPTGKRVIGWYEWERGPGDVVNIPPEFMWHTKDRNPKSAVRGLGLMSRLRWYIRLEDQQDDWNWNRYAQGFPTQVIVAYRGKFQPGDRERIEEDLNRRYMGPGGRRLMLVEGDALNNAQFDFKEFPRPSNDEIGFIEEKKDKRAVYAMAGGLPPKKLGDYSDAFRANAEEQTADYWRDTIIKKLHNPAIESLNSNFLPKFFKQDPNLFFAYDYSGVEALAQSADSKSQIAQRNVESGMWSPNEGRVFQGWAKDPDPTMDRKFRQGLPLGEQRPAPPPIVRSVEQARNVVSIELARLRQKMAKSADILSLHDEKELFKEKLGSKLRRMIEIAADEFYELSGVAAVFDVATPAVIEFIGQREMVLTDAVVTNTIDMVRSAIADAYANGLTNMDLREVIQQAFKERREDWQLERIANTEIHAVQEGAGYHAARQAGVEMKRWITARDSKVRGLDPKEAADHDGIEAAGPVPLDSPFQDPRSHSMMLYPGDGSLGAKGTDTINCRCSWIADFGKYEIDLDAAWYKKASTLDKFQTEMKRLVRSFLNGMEERALEEFDRQEARNAAQ